ncbi:MAG: class I SAM-dependent methyltransferase [Hyphomicrobiaceae bacterium]|nr:class I SAM-dependent methyltransferase [Hyphomicrobiaceae bacterium]
MTDGPISSARRSALPGAPAALSLVAMNGFADYALLDCGGGRKLERFGAITVDRPELQAMWQPRLAAGEWAAAHAVFSGGEDEEKGRWRTGRPVPDVWPVEVGGVTMLCRLSAFRHLGLFPEQLPHWEWMLDGLRRVTGTRPRVLNLFAYTGAASLIAARAGAEVAHIDASKKAIAWAKENQAASGLAGAPVRWMLDDARKFVAREVRRGRTYHTILVDPPKFGRGPGNEVWELFEHLPDLMRGCARLLDPACARLCLTAYAIRASALAIDGLVREVLAERGGEFDSGELAIVEQSGGRAIGTSLFTRWSSP